MRTALFRCAVFAALPFSSQALEKTQVFCGLGPSPDSPAFEAHRHLQAQQKATLGYLLVCDENLRRFDYFASAQPLEKFSKRLAFKPVELDATPFHQFQFRGGTPDDAGGAGWAGLHRTFQSASGEIIDLLERDMSVSSGSRSVDPALQLERINGLPAQLVSLRSTSGRTVSILFWVEGRRSYELSISSNHPLSNPLQRLRVLAEAIPQSVPANEQESEGQKPMPPARLNGVK